MFTRRRLAEVALALAAAAGVMAGVWRAADVPAVRALEAWSLDLRLRLRGPRPPGPEVALVLVDDRSLARLGRWPFSRRLLARATDAIDRQGARVIVFDMLFSEPEAPVPAQARTALDATGRLLARRHPDLANSLARLAEDDPDAALAAAFRHSGKVLAAFAFRFDGDAGAQEAAANRAFTAAAYARFGRSPRRPTFPLHPTGLLMPIPPIAAAAAGLGHVDVAFDVDGAPRYEYLALPFGADFLPPLSMRALALYLGVPWSAVSLDLGGGLDIGTLRVPADAAMRLLVDYRGPRRTFPTYSFADALDGSLPAGALKDRIVLVGAAATGINDSFRTPFGSAPVPGVERMANVIDTALHGIAIRRPALLVPAEAAAVVALAGLAALAGLSLPTWMMAAAWLAVIAGWLVAAQMLLGRGLWLSLAAPVPALLAAMLAALAWRIAVVDRDGRRIRSAFRRYLAPEMVDRLAHQPERLRLGGETRTMTVLFCDVRNFTTLSETVSEQDLVRLLNRLFTPLVDVILGHHGTVDKFIGDCVMAFWNAPLDDPAHATHACRAALSMIQAAEAVSRANVAAGLPPIAVGVGLNTGACCVGNLGSEQRFDYSVVGDAVNVASRMEGLTKAYDVPLVAAEGTRAAAPDLPWRYLDEVRVKGRAQAVRVYTLAI